MPASGISPPLLQLSPPNPVNENSDENIPDPIPGIEKAIQFEKYYRPFISTQKIQEFLSRFKILEAPLLTNAVKRAIEEKKEAKQNDDSKTS